MCFVLQVRAETYLGAPKGVCFFLVFNSVPLSPPDGPERQQLVSSFTKKKKQDPQRETDLPDAIVKVVSERAGKNDNDNGNDGKRMVVVMILTMKVAVRMLTMAVVVTGLTAVINDDGSGDDVNK